VQDLNENKTNKEKNTPTIYLIINYLQYLFTKYTNTALINTTTKHKNIPPQTYTSLSEENRNGNKTLNVRKSTNNREINPINKIKSFLKSLIIVSKKKSYKETYHQK
jgi:hypothetical protein